MNKESIRLSFILIIDTHERFVCFIDYRDNLLDKEEFYIGIQFTSFFPLKIVFGNVHFSKR